MFLFDQPIGSGNKQPPSFDERMDLKYIKYQYQCNRESRKSITAAKLSPNCTNASKYEYTSLPHEPSSFAKDCKSSLEISVCMVFVMFSAVSTVSKIYIVQFLSLPNIQEVMKRCQTYLLYECIRLRTWVT